MRRTATVALVVGTLVVSSACQVPWKVWVSADAQGGDADGSSYLPSISGDGSLVAFTSSASDLVAGDTNGHTDVFVRDLATGAVTLVSEGVGGAPADHSSRAPQISADGSTVVFTSRATNLVPGGTSGSQAFVHDLVTGETTALTDVASGQVRDPDVSADGTLVAYAHDDTPEFYEGTATVELVDRDTGTTTTVTTETEPIFEIDLSDDGSTLAWQTHFHSGAPGEMVPFAETIWVHDVDTGTTTLGTPRQANPAVPAIGCGSPSLSADGSLLAFTCVGDEIDATLPNEHLGFVRDLTAGATEVISLDDDGALLRAREAGIDAEGRLVTFAAFTGSDGGQMWLRDRSRATSRPLSARSTELSYGSAISADSRVVAFATEAPGIVPGDTDTDADVVAVAAVIPEITSVSPGTIAAGTTVEVTIGGHDLSQPLSVSAGADVEASPVFHIDDQTIVVELTVDEAAAIGPRTVIVEQPAWNLDGPGVPVSRAIAKDSLEITAAG